ncbi:MAG: bifunctional phosphopantothenoylcysteine decarboxylase/phosphopantothenate--cysteine ligase CoaBC [Desulfarculales bacterium]|jgi:phosphopantothenoylcysteine decarboxylase/phosphopantothenate--cysteine ligase|nr:bifunctional phosphopantothenoylcysteine decarboxylase/phosphopantothenate--cysteine ligase CoaBC [Desulfarculales bacterium]
MSRNIVLGVTGGIAAYKAAALASLLVKNGYTVQAVMTKGGESMLGPATLAAITGRTVPDSEFNPDYVARIPHIELARFADVVAVAPATANFLAKAACGIADDLLTSLLLPTAAPLLLAPAMNPHMWNHPTVQHNVEILRRRGVYMVGPATGRTACGEEGAGRMSEPEQIMEAIEDILTPKDLTGLKLVVSAGPTHEYIDPVRYITNPSSGRMGIAIARAARRRGARVHLVMGPVGLPAPWGVSCSEVVTVEEMQAAVNEAGEDAAAIIMAAAVGDFKVETVRRHKSKKIGGPEIISFIPTTDILAELGRNKNNRVLVGFAAETQDLLNNAAAKVAKKNLDFIVANDISLPGSGFAGDTNQVSILDASGQVERLEMMSKYRLAGHILDRVAALIRQKSAS